MSVFGSSYLKIMLLSKPQYCIFSVRGKRPHSQRKSVRPALELQLGRLPPTLECLGFKSWIHFQFWLPSGWTLGSIRWSVQNLGSWDAPGGLN